MSAAAAPPVRRGVGGGGVCIYSGGVRDRCRAKEVSPYLVGVEGGEEVCRSRLILEAVVNEDVEGPRSW